MDLLREEGSKRKESLVPCGSLRYCWVRKESKPKIPAEAAMVLRYMRRRRMRTVAVVERRISGMLKGVRVWEFGRSCDHSVDGVGARKVRVETLKSVERWTEGRLSTFFHSPLGRSLYHIVFTLPFHFFFFFLKVLFSLGNCCTSTFFPSFTS